MRLNADLIARSPTFFNALKDREIDLRGNKIAMIENLAALQVRQHGERAVRCTTGGAVGECLVDQPNALLGTASEGAMARTH